MSSKVAAAASVELTQFSGPQARAGDNVDAGRADSPSESKTGDPPSRHHGHGHGVKRMGTSKMNVAREAFSSSTASIVRHATDELTQTRLNGAAADALSVFQRWGKKQPVREKSEKQKAVEKDNEYYRDHVYMSCRWQARDICDNPSGRVICLGVFNKVINYTLIAAILGSVIFFILDSFNLESVSGDCDVDVTPDRDALIANGSLTCSVQLFEACGDGCFFWVEGLLTAIFTVEFVVRLVVAESYFRQRKWTALYNADGSEVILELEPDRPFLFDLMNYCDLLAILPFFIELGLTDSAPATLGVLKLLRVVRVFKIARHFSGSKVMWLTVKMSARGLLVAFFFLAVFLFFASVLLQVADPCITAEDCTFVDPINGAYYVVVTMSTVGYGDQVPQLLPSRLGAALFMFFGTFYIAMPLAVVGNKFEAAFKFVYGDEEVSSTISAYERRQIILNQAYQMRTLIDMARSARHNLTEIMRQGADMSVGAQLVPRRMLYRTMKQLEIIHAALCTHVDILTPSTVLLKKKHGDDELGLHHGPGGQHRRQKTRLRLATISSSGSMRIAATLASVAHAAIHRVQKKSSSNDAKGEPHTEEADAPRVETNAGPKTKVHNQHQHQHHADDEEDMVIESVGSPTGEHARRHGEDDSVENPASSTAQTSSARVDSASASSTGDVNEEEDEEVEEVKVVSAPGVDGNRTDVLVTEAGSTQHEEDLQKGTGAARPTSKSSGKAEKVGDSGKNSAGPPIEDAYPGTIVNVSCSKRYFNVEFDDVDRERVGMEKLGVDVHCQRICPLDDDDEEAFRAGDPDREVRRLDSETLKRVKRLKKGDRVLVFTKEQKLQGIAEEMRQELAQRRSLIQMAKKGRQKGRWRDTLWLFLEAPEEFADSSSCMGRFAKAFSFLRVFIVSLSVVGVVIQTYPGLNTYGPATTACQREAATWCANVQWAAELADQRYGNIGDLNWPCFPQRCSNFSATEDLRSPGNMLLCNEGVDDVFYPGILADPTSFPFSDPRLRLNVSCGGTTVDQTSATVTTTVPGIASRNQIVNVTSRSTVVGADPFQYSKTTQSLMLDLHFGDVLVCDRRPCVDNSEQQLFVPSDDDTGDELAAGTAAPQDRRRRLSGRSTVEVGEQLATNKFFGYLEVFFCSWYLVEYLLGVAATRSPAVTDKVHAQRWYKDPATWIELVSMIVCLAELVAVSVEADSLAYTVWGMPFVQTFSNTIMRPLRVVVMIRLCVMMRGVDSMKILVRTVKETYERLAVPIFFLLVFSLIFAGLFYTFETLLQCDAIAECSDGSTDLSSCPGDDAFLETGVGTVIVYRHSSDILMGPAAGDMCLLQSMWDAIWLAFVTISTVGYGVLYPVTSGGKGVAMIAAAFGTIYLAMPLSIVGSRFYSIYEEYEKVTSLRKAKSKLRNAMGAVLTINMKRGTLGHATQEAKRTGNLGPLRQELAMWRAKGKSRDLPVYKEAVQTLAEVEADMQAFDKSHSSGLVANFGNNEDTGVGGGGVGGRGRAAASTPGGGLFNPKQLQFLLQYCEYNLPSAEIITDDDFDELTKMHEQFLSTVAEQFLFHDEWGVAASGPLVRREHDLHL